MRRKITQPLTIFLALLIVLSALVILPVSAQTASPEGLYFEQTGHWVKGAFLVLYQQAADPVTTFGMPITDEIQDPSSGNRSQYFSKARFDLMTDAAGEHVVLMPLGELLYSPGEKPDFPTRGLGCMKQKDNEVPVCYAFMEFLKSDPDAWLLGNAISEIEVQNGRLVQHFQFGKLVWMPDNPLGQQVQRAELGYQYFNTRIGNADLLAPDMSVPLTLAQINLQAHAFPENYVLPADGHQSIYIIVRDQRNQPVSGASILVTIQWPTGKKDQLRMTDLTDANGIAVLHFATSDKYEPNQLVTVSLEIQLGGKLAHASTWFRTSR